MRTPAACLAMLASMALPAPASDGNRLAYLDESDPNYVGRAFPKLVTPQWVGEPGVEAVVVLAIDDMRDNSAKYEAYLRPILDRLKAIDGRAPVSIMTNRLDPADPQLRRWLAEGVNLDAHTLDHPCPLLQKNDFDAARDTYHGCVDRLAKVPNNRPVAFRMPCCDSLNTPSPRFFAEIFNRTSLEDHHLSIDSSVFCVLTPDDPELPREMVLDPDGRERFRKYIPFPSFVNTIEDYPYPYIIGRMCWEFPCIVPSDWEAQNLHRPNNPKTVEDLKAALDAVVVKQGVFNLVFHPHGWIENTQVVELIDHAVAKHGKKVKFLNFREALERLEANLLKGQSLRDPFMPARDNGIRLVDVNDDGFLDVVGAVSGFETTSRWSRVWDPGGSKWIEHDLPGRFLLSYWPSTAVRFGVLEPGGPTTILAQYPNYSYNEAGSVVGADGTTRLEAFRFGDAGWEVDRDQLTALQAVDVLAKPDEGLLSLSRLRDVDGDGVCEMFVDLGPPTKPEATRVYSWSPDRKAWERLPFSTPGRSRIATVWNAFHGFSLFEDAGMRFVDLDEDGRLDVVFSDDRSCGAYLFDSMERGWSRTVVEQPHGDSEAIPRIVKITPPNPQSRPENNGLWVHSRHLWWQNENTASLPDLVDRRSFDDLLKDVEPRPKEPEAALRTIRARPGFRVELAAAEPLVADPIAFDWSADGRLWVVEMGDYPLGEDGQGKPGGQVRVLEDRDGDGRYDASTVFLDGLGFPTGIMPWRDGVLVACAPDVLFAADRDGDGVADVRRTLFSGFGEGNQQHRVNGFAFGLDGWVYGANGDSGGTITSAATGEKFSIQGRDFRFDPDAGAFEAESGMTQFGRRRDDWGRWFGTNNPSWGWHYVLSDRDLRRNPLAALASPRQVLDPDTRVYPLSRTLARFNDPHAANRVTSANSPEPYRDDLFGPDFASSLFVSEPVHNLVRRVVLEPAGPTLRGGRAAGEEDREFLASTDHWFRPTTIKTGPDGALWVADMYRAVIEHPEWIPDDWEAKLDLRAGHDRGRIYRVVPVDRPARPIPRLDRLDAEGLAAAMDSPNGWVRDTAMRLLAHDHRGHAGAVAILDRLAREADDPKVRLQAVCTLDLIDRLTPDRLAQALVDAHPKVRRQAARLASARVAVAPELAGPLLALADDPDAEVRLAAATALGDWPDLRAGEALARVALRDRDDGWVRSAVLSSATPHASAILAGLFAGSGPEGPPPALVGPLFVTLGAGDRAGLTGLVRVVTTPAGPDGAFAGWQFSALAGLRDAADRAGSPLERWNAGDPGWAGALAGLARLRESARDVLASDDADVDDRVRASGVLGRVALERGADLDALAGVLQPRVPAEVQRSAIEAIARTRDRRVPDRLLAGWRGHGPAARAAVLDALLGRDEWAAALLSSLEDTCVPAAEVGPAARGRLLEHADPALRDRAAAVFGAVSPDRQAIVDAYAVAASRPGDEAAGAVVFRRACASCHRLGEVGHEVGPDLAALADRDPMALLVAILDPNRVFEATQAEFAIHAADGRVLRGIVAAETATGVTLLGPEGRRETLLRVDVEAMAATGTSLMPEGLERDITAAEMADLLAFLRSSGPPPKEIEGNRPALVRPGPDGTIPLKAETAEIRGPGLTFEATHGNLGWWSSPEDRAGWRFEADRSGQFEVWVEYACDASAGGVLGLDVGGESLRFEVGPTGTWDDYREARLGVVTLPAGPGRLDARAVGPIRGALLDLRSIELRPVPAECCGEGLP